LNKTAGFFCDFCKDRLMKKSILLLTVFLSACTHLTVFNQETLRKESTLPGYYDALTLCVLNQLHGDTRRFFRLLQYYNRHFPALGQSEIYAYDTRFLPGIHASNSPTNPDAVLDYVNPKIEVFPGEYQPINWQPGLQFTLILNQTSDNAVSALLNGDRFLGEITWDFLMHCRL